MNGILDNRRAIVTGGGTGIGRAIAVGLAAAGADVAVISRTRSTLEDAVAEIEATGRRGLAVTADLRELGEISSLFDGVCGELGGLDIVVNSAGVQLAGDSLEFSVDDWETTISTNLSSLFFCCQAAARHFVKQGHGKIVNIGSTFSLVGAAQFAAYCASKGGVLQLTRALAVEWSSLGINVNAIGPTAIRTKANAALLDDPEFMEFFLPKLPVGRVGEPSDVVGAAVFLSSSQSDFVHGHLLLVDGAYTVV